jgi:hypothetical protein
MANFNLNDLLVHTTMSETGCMEWQRARTSAGYSQIWDGEKVQYAHRIVCKIVHGEPAEKQEVMHSCDNPSCINPDHLTWGSRKDNMVDASQKGRLIGRNHVKGEAHPSSPLSELDIKVIRDLRDAGATLTRISEAYGVSIAAIHNITTRKTWKEVA